MGVKEIIQVFNISQKDLDKLLAILAYLDEGETLQAGIGKIEKVNDCTIKIKSDLDSISEYVHNLLGREVYTDETITED